MKLRLAIIVPVLLTALPAAEAADLARGQRVYFQHCVSCHGPRGESVTPGVPVFAKGERINQPDMLLLQTVRNGKGGQPPFFGRLSDPEILDAIAFSRTLR